MINALGSSSLGTMPSLRGNGGQPRMSPTERFTQDVEEFDVDGDGALSVDEFSEAGGPQEAFSIMDANSDGILTGEEVKTNAPQGPPPDMSGRQGMRGMQGQMSTADIQQSLIELLAQNKSEEESNGAFASYNIDAQGLTTASHYNIASLMDVLG